MWGHTLRNSRCSDLQKLADRLDDCTGIQTHGEPVVRLSKAVLTIEQGTARGKDRDPISCMLAGMLTRQPLLEKMRVDGSGVLGVIQLLDFDRLCAFDPAAGDTLFQMVSSRLQAMLPPSRLLAHVDRAHLAIWFGKDTSEDAASRELEAIKYALGETVQIGNRMILPEASTQIASCSGESGSTVLAQLVARSALAASSISPAAQVRGPEFDEGESFLFEQDLRLAIARGEMRLCYQPIIDAAAARICGIEALARWQSPRRGAVSPALFVPVLEAVGLAHELGMWALNTAVRDVRRWHERQLSGLRVAVNVSGHQLEHDDLPTHIARTLSRHGVPPHCLEIELTEGVATADCDRAARLFSQIRAMGVTIAIDDFGTGYSSLSTLRKLAFDKIKIDREFVSEVDRRQDSQAICQSIIALARGLGIRVLAEGVERPEEYAWLRQHGCNLYQGFYFAPPLEPEALVGFAKNPIGLSAKLALDARALQHDVKARLSA